MEQPAAHTSAEHLCVLVHGYSACGLSTLGILNTNRQLELWGNPNHLANAAKTLRGKHPEENLHILVAKRNSGSFTYDGVELGGERVCQEIKEELEKLAQDGQTIKKLSVVGYSLGGLVARYAVGLLYSRGVFDKLEPVVSRTRHPA
jgi:triacylglycerol esterase/lipase EstA (alpha/beta hydrolase family)